MIRNRNLRNRPVIHDAGGARRREEQRRVEADRRLAETTADYERVRRAAGKIPLLKKLADVTLFTTPVRSILSKNGSLSFPALQVSPKLAIDDVFKALSGNYQHKTPNVTSERHDETSVGAHFDHYYGSFIPWTLHENLTGTGIIRAKFLPSKQFAAYRSLADALPSADGAQELLAQNRAAMGAMALQGAGLGAVFVGDIAPGTRTLLWHGDNNTPPAVHDIVRDGPGSYTIYAVQERGELAEGFEHLPS